MIPAAFDYVRAGSLGEAIDLLQHDPDGTKLVAGGHTLIPTLKLRLASPALLVDIRGLAELKRISIDDKAIRIGALTTHAELLASEPLHDLLPIFRHDGVHRSGLCGVKAQTGQIQFCGTAAQCF